MTAIGHGRHTKEPIGWHPTTNESNSLRVIGAETAVESSMIIIGIVDETETANMIETEATIGSGTTGAITTANRRRMARCNGLCGARQLSNKGRV